MELYHSAYDLESDKETSALMEKNNGQTWDCRRGLREGASGFIIGYDGRSAGRWTRKRR